MWDRNNGSFYSPSDVVWILVGENIDLSNYDAKNTDWNETIYIINSGDDATDSQNETHDFI